MFRTYLIFFLGLIFVLSPTMMPACYGMTTNHESGVTKKRAYFILNGRESLLTIPSKSKINLNYIQPKMRFSYNELKHSKNLYDNQGVAINEAENSSPVVYEMKVAAAGGAGIGLLLGEVVAKASGHHHSFLRSAWLGAASAAAVTGAASFFEQKN